MSTDTITRVAPTTLLIGPNVRKEVTLRPEFVASIKEHGILVPIIAQQTDDGLEVLDGQMRTLAAVDAGLTEVPVFVQPAIADEASRIVEQIVVNEDRSGLTMTDHVGAIAQLALDFKIPVAAIAKRTGATKEQVAQAVAASKSPHATAAIGADGLTLELAAQIAEAGLDEAETRRVVETRYNREYAIQQVLADRERAAEIVRLTEKVQGEGVTIVAKPSHDEYNAAEKNKHRYLEDLVDASTSKKITTAGHKKCDGHAAFVGVRGYRGVVEVHCVCTDPAKHGHRDKNKAAPVVLTDEERAQKQVEKERTLQWLEITTVRLAWIREQLLTRKTLPAGWDLLVLNDLTETHARAWSQWGGLALELVGQVKAEDDWNPGRTLAAWGIERPVNTWRAALASIIARHETEISGKTGWGRVSTVYLSLLVSWGYELSEVEQGLVDAAAVQA